MVGRCLCGRRKRALGASGLRFHTHASNPGCHIFKHFVTLIHGENDRFDFHSWASWAFMLPWLTSVCSLVFFIGTDRNLSSSPLLIYVFCHMFFCSSPFYYISPPPGWIFSVNGAVYPVGVLIFVWSKTCSLLLFFLLVRKFSFSKVIKTLPCVFLLLLVDFSCG